jgi:hypothetical protein
MMAFPIDAKVGNVKNDDASLIAPVAIPDEGNGNLQHG